MQIHFNKVQLVNFGSYENSEIELANKNFCLVSGQNNFIKDNALSNGSGKSTIWSAICWALTGETISGAKNNLKNINSTDDSQSYVLLDLDVDADNYILNRSIAPKSDLKITKNGVDISGKGIRESEKILAENLPDITKDLISSTILLGQGMPNRFSSFSPSGRKDLLETLTKSDFMITDIKTRVATRQQELAQQLRTYEDSLLTNNTQLNMNLPRLDELKAELNKISTVDYTTLINELSPVVANLNTKLFTANSNLTKLETTNESLSDKLFTRSAEKAAENDEEFKAYSSAYNDKNSAKQVKQTSIAFIEADIKKLSSIKDVCPTCGQKIPGAIKPDTTEQLNKIAALTAEIDDLEVQLEDISTKHKNYLDQIDLKYQDILDYQEELKNNKLSITSLKIEINNISTELASKTEELNTLTYDKQNNEKSIAAIKSTIEDLEKNIAMLTTNNKIIEAAVSDINERLAIIRQMETLSKREFRGYLLYNIIEYLNKKAKEYSQIVFGTSELNIYLDNNALDISYCDKLYESLSGGEKQRVDLIAQFAIRDLLQYYFNYSSNILVLDEITDNLDRLATGKIFDLITEKLGDIESVFIISHHADELEIPVDSEIQVIKKENGISYVREI